MQTGKDSHSIRPEKVTLKPNQRIFNAPQPELGSSQPCLATQLYQCMYIVYTQNHLKTFLNLGIFILVLLQNLVKSRFN